MLDEVDVAAIASPIEVPRLCLDILVALYVFDLNPFQRRLDLQLHDVLG